MHNNKTGSTRYFIAQSHTGLLIDLGKKTLFGENKTAGYFCFIAENLIRRTTVHDNNEAYKAHEETFQRKVCGVIVCNNIRM
jgi:hypothetical protein